MLNIDMLRKGKKTNTPAPPAATPPTQTPPAQTPPQQGTGTGYPGWNIAQNAVEQMQRQNLYDKNISVGDYRLGQDAWRNVLNQVMPNGASAGTPTVSMPTGVGNGTQNGAADGTNGVTFTRTDDPDGGWYAQMAAMLDTPEKRAERERINRSRMGILALGDAMRNIGNVIYTTKYAPSQKFNEPVKEQSALDTAYEQNIMARDLKAREILRKAENDRLAAKYREAMLDLRRSAEERAKKSADSLDKAREASIETSKARTNAINEGVKLNQRKQENLERHQKFMENEYRQRTSIQRAAQRASAANAQKRTAIMQERNNIMRQRGGSISAGKTTMVYDQNGNPIAMPKTFADNSASVGNAITGIYNGKGMTPQEYSRLKKASKDEQIAWIANHSEDPAVRNYMGRITGGGGNGTGSASGKTFNGGWRDLISTTKKVAGGKSKSATSSTSANTPTSIGSGNQGNTSSWLTDLGKSATKEYNQLLKNAAKMLSEGNWFGRMSEEMADMLWGQFGEENADSVDSAGVVNDDYVDSVILDDESDPDALIQFGPDDYVGELPE